MAWDFTHKTPFWRHPFVFGPKRTIPNKHRFSIVFFRGNPYLVGNFHPKNGLKFNHSGGKKQKQHPKNISSNYHSPSSSCFQGPYTSQLPIALQQSGFLHSAAQHGGWAQMHRAMQQLRPGIPAVQQVGSPRESSSRWAKVPTTPYFW